MEIEIDGKSAVRTGPKPVSVVASAKIYNLGADKLINLANLLTGQHCWIGGWGSAFKKTDETFLSKEFRDSAVNIFRCGINLNKPGSHTTQLIAS